MPDSVSAASRPTQLANGSHAAPWARRAAKDPEISYVFLGSIPLRTVGWGWCPLPAWGRSSWGGFGWNRFFRVSRLSGRRRTVRRLALSAWVHIHMGRFALALLLDIAVH